MLRKLLSLATLILLAGPASAATPAGPPAAPETVAPDSPRASFSQFLEAARRGNWDAAAGYLELRGEPPARAQRLAQRLVAVLDHNGLLDPALFSPSSEGQANDGLPADIDQIGRIQGDRGLEPVRVVRRTVGTEGARWLFTHATVEHVDEWYERLDDLWVREHLPEAFLRPGWRGLLWWQWLAFPFLIGFGYLFGKLFSFVTRRGVRPLLVRTKGTWDEELLDRLTGPIAWIGGLLGTWLLLPMLGLNPSAHNFVLQLLRAGLLVGLFWGLLRGIDEGAQVIARSPWAKVRPATAGLLPLGVRVAKLGALAMAVIAVLSELGFPMASLIAGLGIGGLAVALAAQKTLENLMGSVAISIDQPFRVGDFVKVEDVMGTVEFIGLRSTRIRTLERTIVTYPNGKLADMRSESFGPRDKIRLLVTLNLDQQTKAEQMKHIIKRVDEVLAAHPKKAPDAHTVRFTRIAPAFLELEIFAFIATKDWDEFTAIRQELLLKFMEIVESSGAKLTLPAQEVHLAKQSGG